jgi:transposase-like protein
MNIIKICKKHGNLLVNNVIKAGLNKSSTQRYKCKLCQQEFRKSNYLKNKDKIKLKNKIWKLNNPERSKELNKRYKRKKQISFQEKINFYESLKPSVLQASKKLIGCIIELNRMERRVNKKCR